MFKGAFEFNSEKVRKNKTIHYNIRISSHRSPFYRSFILRGHIRCFLKSFDEKKKTKS